MVWFDARLRITVSPGSVRDRVFNLRFMREIICRPKFSFILTVLPRRKGEKRTDLIFDSCILHPYPYSSSTFPKRLLEMNEGRMREGVSFPKVYRGGNRKIRSISIPC